MYYISVPFSNQTLIINIIHFLEYILWYLLLW